MFSNLGLFAQHSCPDSTCRGSSCLFSHGNAARSNGTRTTGSSTSPAKRPRAQPAPVTAVGSTSRTATSQPSSRNVPQDIQHRSNATVPRTSAAPTTVAAPVGNEALAGPPRLPPTKFSPQPIADRQKSIRTLFTQFSKLYSAILPQQPNLAHESTLAQEQDISASTGNIRAYRLAIHNAAASVSRRPPPDRIPHPSIGTVKESRIATQADAKKKASHLTSERLEPYLVNSQVLVDWGYPDPNDIDIRTQQEPDPHGVMRICDRCKVEFVVTPSNETGPCTYHSGKLAPEKQEGKRVWLYSCCGKERGAAGCEDSIHVFSFKDDDKRLAAYVPYMTTKQVSALKGDSSLKALVVGMDCEMIYTTAGSWIGRVTVVDGEHGKTLLDEFVRQDHHVLDYNHKFSGVSEELLKTAAMDLEEVRSAVCSFISPETYVVGHGLENDFRALRLLHDRVIDTAILFPHDKGHPFRRALRDLVKEKLGYFIQQSSVQGHSSAEDAQAALELVKWKVRDDAT